MSPGAERSDLPRGTVTLLFSDIEGSTRALAALGDRYGATLARHRELLRGAFGRFGGSEVDTQGDGFLVAFERAGDAVAAAGDAQRALAAERWTDDARIRVRMGIHTGEPTLEPEGYVGLDVHRAARICSAAHGGQVLLSAATRSLVGGEALAGAELRDLGDHRLKDLERPERLFELVVAGLPDERLPPRTASAFGLPAPSNRLVGRTSELADVRGLLERPDVHLVTLTGPGGTGKSRLAIELAWEAVERYPDGAALVRLAQVGDAELVATAVAASLGVRETAGRPLAEALEEHLRERELLLVLDNFEHVAAAAPLVARLVDAAPGLRVLTTSRTPVGISGEHVRAIEPLPEDDAIALFVERATAADHRFDAEGSRTAVIEICRRLDGLPLAIELAAARVALLPPAALLDRLGLALLSGGPADRPERQRTVRATIDWSYGLLTPGQRRLHSELAVFAGGCSLEAIEQTCDADDVFDDLAALVAGSLLHRADADGEPRFRMLEVVRQYALAALTDDGRLDAQSERHAGWVVALAEEAEVSLAGPEQSLWLERLEHELPNVRAALDWAIAAQRPELALRIASSLGRFWRARGHVEEARRWLETALALDGDVAPEVEAAGRWAAARQAMAQGDHVAARPLLEAALELYRGLGRGREEVFALCELGLAALAGGDAERAEDLCERALAVARTLGDDRAVSAALSQLAGVVSERGDHARARELHEEALALRRRLGDPLLVANAANNLGVAALAEGDLDRARSALQEALSLARELGDRIHLAAAACGLGQTALLAGDDARAVGPLADALEAYVALGDGRDGAECVSALAAAAAVRGRPEDAARLWGCADSLRGAPASGVAATIEARFRPGVVATLGPEVFAREAALGAAVDLEGLAAGELAPLPVAALPQ